MFDAFLKLDGIEGESPDAKHGKEIQLLSFSFGAAQPATAAVGGGMGAGKVQFQDLHCTHHVDKASPKLLLACATGQHIPKGVMVVRKAGGEQLEYITVTMTDVMVSSVSAGGTASGSEVPNEQFSLNFSKIQFDYKEQKPDGSLGGTVAMGYDVKANKKV